MPDENGRPTVGDALSAVGSRMAKLEQRILSSEAASEEERLRQQLTGETLNLINNEFRLTGENAITNDTEGLDYGDPTKFYHSATKVAAQRIRSMKPADDDEDEGDEEDEPVDDSPITARALDRALSRVMGGGTTASPRPNMGHREVTSEDVRAVAESAGGARGMAASIAAIKDLNKRAESSPKTQRFLTTQRR